MWGARHCRRGTLAPRGKVPIPAWEVSDTPMSAEDDRQLRGRPTVHALGAHYDGRTTPDGVAYRYFVLTQTKEHLCTRPLFARP